MIASLKYLKNHAGFMKYFTNISWLFAEKIIRILVMVFISAWVARYLGPEKLGLLSYSHSFVSLFAIISSLGVDTILVRELVKNEGDRDVLMGSAFVIKLIGFALMLFTILISVKFTSNSIDVKMLVLLMSSAVVFQSFNVIDYYFQSKVVSRYAVYANTVGLFTTSLLKVGIIILKAPLIYFVYVIIVDGIVISLGYIYFYYKAGLSMKSWRFEKVVAKNLLKHSWPLIFAGLALSTQSYIDQIMISEMIGFIEVGYYSIAFKFMALFGFLPIIIQNSLFPAIVHSKNKSQLIYEDRMLNYYRLMMIMFLFISVPIYLFGEFIVNLLYGVQYHQAGILFSIFGFRLLFAFFGVGRSSYLLNENRQQHRLYTLLLASIINIILNYIFIPEYGVYGAYATSIISFTFNIFIFDLFIQSTRNNVLNMLKAMFSFWKIKLI